MRRNIPTERNKEDFPNRKFIRYSESYDFYGVSPHELRVMAVPPMISWCPALLLTC